MTIVVFSLAQRLLVHGGGVTTELSYILTMDSLLSQGSTAPSQHLGTVLQNPTVPVLYELGDHKYILPC